MALKSDNQGFLVGDPVDIGKAVDQLRTIRNDVSAIKNALLGAPNSVGNGSKNTAIDRAAKIATPSSQRNRDNKPSAKAATPIRSNSGSGTPSVASAASKGTVASNGGAKSKIVSTPKGRDQTTGRFTSNGGDDEERRSKGILNNFVDRIATTAIDVTAGAEEVDPTIKAFQEVAEPMQRGYQSLFGGGDKDERWYKKIFKELKLFRKDETAFNKAQNKVLKNIENKPVGGGEDSSGFIGGLLGRVAPMVLMAVAGVGSALLAGIGAVLGVIFSPIGLAIGAAATIAWGLFTENGQKFFGEVGAKIIAGWDAVVTAFAPVTESISKGWDTVKGGFDNLINGMSSSWDAFTGFLKDKFGIDIPAILKPVVDVSKKVVEAAKETANAGADKAVEAVKKNSPKTTEALGNAWDKVKEGAGKIKSHATGKSAANKAAMIAEMDAQGITDPNERAMLMAQVDHESGGFTKTKENLNYRSGRLMEVSKTARDKGKPAVDAAVAQGEDAVAELIYGGRMGNVEKGDGAKYRGRGLIQLTGRANYEAAGKDLGLDLINHPELAETPENAAKTAMWYWKKNKLGDVAKSGNVEAVTRKINNGTNGLADRKEKRDRYLAEGTNGNEKPAAVASITDDPTQGGRYKYETLEGGKVQVTDNQTGVMELASDEQANAYRKQQGKPYLDKVAAINAGNMPLYNGLAAGPSSGQTQTAFAAAPKVPAFTPAPTPAEAPPQVTPLASLNAERNITVTMPAPDVRRDVSDRGVAHIVTGGLSGRG
jgi:predicted chitinase